MKERLIRLPATSLGALLFLGCAHTFTVDVKGTQKTETPIPSHVTYAVFPTTEVEKDPTFPEYAKIVAKQLETRGYRQTDAKVAKLGVYLAYGVSKFSAPSGSPPLSQPNTGMAGTMTPGSGTFGATGSTPSMGTAPVYSTHLAVVVTDLVQSSSAGSLVELWRGETRTRGNTSDLPRTIPVLIEAAFRHFGQETPNAVQHVFGEDDVKKLQELR